MKDSRTYVTIHDGMPEHPKLVGLPPATKWLLLELICYCSRTLSDGVVPADVITRLGGSQEDLAALTGNGRGRGPSLEPVPGGFLVHDYLEHQRSAAGVQAARERSVSGAVLSNHRRWHTGRGLSDPDCLHCQSPDRGADRSPDRSPDRGADRGTDMPRTPDPVAVSVSVPVSSTTDVVERPRATRALPRTAATDDWRPSDGAWAWSLREFPAADLERELAQFRDHHLAKGSTFKSWDAAWRTWMRNTEQFAAPARAGLRSTAADVAAGVQLAEQLRGEAASA